MEPLSTTKWVMTWLCMHPVNESSSMQKKIANNKLLCLAMFAINLFSVTACLIFIWKFATTDLVATLFAFNGVATFGASLYTIPIAFFLRYQARKIFKQLSGIYDANKNADAECIELLNRANSISEWIWPLAGKLVVLYSGCNIAVSIASAIYCRSIYGHIKSDRVFHSMNVILPWNTTTTFGYVAEAGFVTIFGDVYASEIFTLLLLFVSICLHHQAFYKIFKHWVDKWNRKERNNSDKKFLCDLIRFHIMVKEWFINTVNFYSPFVMIQLISSVLMLATSIFQFDLQLRSHFDYTLLILFMSVSTGMLNMFLYCYFGKLATESFDRISDCVYDLNWLELPLNLQKYVVIMITDMQISLLYHGFDVAVLNLNTFLRLTRTVFSYYMIFKTIATE